MNDNIQIINKNGEGLFTEGISYIEVPSTGKKYLFYTSNEKVDNDLTKIYIAQTTPEANMENVISDSEWEDLRNKMIKISHKEEAEDVRFLNMNGVNFYVGDPKKLAITAVAKQAFKDAQLSHTMATNQTETPVTSGSNPTFFNQDVVGTQNVAEESKPLEQSIFSNPPQPEISTTVTPSPEQVGTSEVSQIPDIPTEPTTPIQESTAVVNNIPSVETFTQPPAATPESVSQAEQIVQPIQPIAPAMDLNGIDTTLASNVPAFESQPIKLAEEPVPTTENNELSSLDNTPVVDDNINTSSEKRIITDEEALKAINIIQEYINQESENNNQ